MFDFLKPKPKEKPEPSFYLFIGEQQCIGGYGSHDQAFSAIAGEETQDCFIAADMQGDDVLYRWEHNKERQSCGCEWERKGWRVTHGNYLAMQEVSQTVFCGNLITHPIVKYFASGYTTGYLTQTPWNFSGIIVGFPNLSFNQGSGMNTPVDNGDPLQ